MTALLAWTRTHVTYYHCGRVMRWETWKGCYVCTKPGCEATE